MQLVEQGKLDLDADVNKYLDFEIPARDGKPVTLRNIMTHTAGFEEQIEGTDGRRRPSRSTPLGEHLKAWVPTRIFAPGSTPAYSNYATALAGYIVARVSGHVIRRLHRPAHLRAARHEARDFRQPLPEQLEAAHVEGLCASPREPDKPFEIVGPAPAGSLSASGADMARFMIAHLQKGAFGDASASCRQATAEQMHGTALTLLPRVHRMLLGFYEQNYNGRRIIGHGGDTQWFHSNLHLFLDDNVGLFVSVNSPGKEGAARRHPQCAVRAVHRSLPAGARRSTARSIRRRRPSTRA